jgi:FlaG/FlaF family flagellin (archaellin)
MNRERASSNESGVSEVIGTILLLGISVTLFSVVYVTVLSFPGAPSTPSSNIAMSLNETSLTLTHVGGKQISLDSKIKIIIDEESYICNITKGLNTEAEQDKYWGFGEQFLINFSEIPITFDDSEYNITVMVVDAASNSIVIMGTKAITNRPPIIGSPLPYNTSEDVSIDLSQLYISISDPDYDTFNWTIEGKYVISSKSTGDSDGIKSANLITPLPLKTEIIWYVNATDPTGSNLWAHKRYTFTTEGNHPPVYDTPSPVSGSTDNLLSFNWVISINDLESDTFNWVIQCSNGQSASRTGDSNGIKSLSLSGLSYSTTYRIWVNATDPTGSGEYTRSLYTFTTVGNNPPSYGTPSPATSSTENQLSLTWSISINDSEANNFNWWISCSNGQSTNASGQSNGTKSISLSGLTYSMTYTVWVNATDPTGSGLWTNRSYTFTTKTNNPPTLSNPSPVNGSTGVLKYHATNVTVTDLEGQYLTVCFWYSISDSPYSWTKAQQNNSVTANTTVKDIYTSYSSSKNTWYWWKVTVYDGYVNSSAIYKFRTGSS